MSTTGVMGSAPPPSAPQPSIAAWGGDAVIAGAKVQSAKGETLTASAVDSINTFAAPNTVVAKPVSAKVEAGKLALTVEPKSVTVLSLEP